MLKLTAPSLIQFFEPEESDDGRVIFSGYLGKMASDILSRLNTNYTFELMDKYDNAGFVNGTWTGLLGSVVTGKADITAVPIPCFHDGFENVTYTYPIATVSWVFLSGKPIEEIKNEYAILSIFHLEVWIGINLMFLVTPIVSAGQRMLLGRNRKTFYKVYREDLLLTLELLLGQGGNIRSKRISLRIIWCCYAIAALCISSCFTGMLLSKLTLPTQKRYFENFGQLRNSPNVKISSLINGPVHIMLKKRESEESIKLLERFVEMDISNLDEMLRTVDEIVQGKAVGIYSQNTLLEFAETILSEHTDRDKGSPFYMSKNTFTEQYLSYTVRRNLDPYIKARFIKLALMHFESDLFYESLRLSTHMKKEIYFSGDTRVDHFKDKPLILNNYKIPFVVLFSGLMLASVARCASLMNIKLFRVKKEPKARRRVCLLPKQYGTVFPHELL